MHDRLADIVGRQPPGGAPQYSTTDDNDKVPGEMPDSDNVSDELTAQLLEQTEHEMGEVKKLINQVVSNTQEIIVLEGLNNDCSTQEEQREILAKLDELIFDTRAHGKTIKTKLDIIKSKNEEYDSDHRYSTLAQWRHNQLNTTCLRFQQSISAFNSASAHFKQSLREKTARQVRLVNSDVTDEQIEEIVNSSDPSLYMQQHLMMVPDAMLDRVSQIEERHEGIVQIEQGVRELQQLFQDLATLVDAQQEQLDQIEYNVNQTLDYTERGNDQLEKAHRHQKSARRKQFYLCLVLLVITLIFVFVFIP